MAPLSSWLPDVLKISVPVVLGAIIWAIQTLAQRAWTEYERRLEVYSEIVRLADSLFPTGTADDRRHFLQAIRSAWLVGSDEVIRAANALLANIVATPPVTSEQRDASFRIFMMAMRHDLRKRRWLPPSRTTLTDNDFRIDAP
jgi:hypothetical protein